MKKYMNNNHQENSVKVCNDDSKSLNEVFNQDNENINSKDTNKIKKVLFTSPL